MQRIARVEELVRVGVYADPNRRNQTIPLRLPEGIENIELMLDGEVMFGKDGKQQKFGRGSIFWHLKHEFDIWRSVHEKHYRCTVFTFRVSKRVPPTVPTGIWQNPDTLDRFVNEAVVMNCRCSSQNLGQQLIFPGRETIVSGIFRHQETIFSCLRTTFGRGIAEASD